MAKKSGPGLDGHVESLWTDREGNLNRAPLG